MDFIDLKTQYRRLKPSVDARIAKVLEHGQYVMGPEVAELEQRLAEYVGTRHCIGVASGTDALMMSLMALGVGHDDEVITVPFTFFATAEVVALLGAKPVFIDVDRRSYNMDPARLEAAITPRTKAIMPVSLYGQCPDIDAIEQIARKHGLPVIEDAAQSFGATYKGKRSGGLTAIGATSFFPSKPLGCYGDGGALFTNDDDHARVLREIRIHGQDRRYHHPRLGITGRLDSIQAAVLLAKLETFDEEVRARARLGARYAELIGIKFGKGAQAQVQAPEVDTFNTCVFAQYTVEVDNREIVETRMKQLGVPTAVHYPLALHMQPVFKHLGHREGDFPNSESAARRVISLPMHPYLTDEQQVRVVDALAQAVA
ncbi:MAG TPA: DegT/DnrJ/EryC1/StrS family aminotransferase [Steroidobacteraceae bacterium]|nr:DegT/DnrJ/EryC1/StrS family aminotransferase [Steroidobacteraceae bacterium]